MTNRFPTESLRFSILALLAIITIVISSAIQAGGHTGSKKPAEPIIMDPALRGETTGTVLVTGANRGIGLEIARNYAERGWTVFATARKPNKATDLNAIATKYDKVTVVQMDLLDHDGIDALAEKLKDVPIDVLLNNAATLGDPDVQNFGEFEYQDLEFVMSVNVAGTLKMVEAFTPHVLASKQKKIVAISSQQGSIGSLRMPSLMFYKMSKAALNMGMTGVARSLKKQGVTVAIISPGAVDTDMMNKALESAGGGFKFKLMTPQDSAEAVINVADQYTIKTTGAFMSHRGKEIPW
jgi:NAD(P)-dependent dehydrogenase (short-subunit alcohol dehydrogenase family)